MHSIITTQLRSAKSRNIATTTAVRLIHASAVQQVGRKRRGGVPSSERKLHAALYEQEDQENDIDELQEWDNDDHHVYGHMLMDGIRDVRRYARQMKFEHPTLAEYKKPFRAPSKSHILEFESSATMGEKIQANDRKVVMRVKVSRLGLSASELHKFVLLAESRYNPQKDELKMSESREVSSLLNKKRLANTLTELIAEAKKKDDAFADVPLNFAHVKYKPKPLFPKSWIPEPVPGAKSKSKSKGSNIES